MAQPQQQALGAAMTLQETFTLGAVEMMYAYPLTLFDGITTTTLDLSLPRNALVDDFRVLVTAQRVDSTVVQEVAQVRSYASSAGHELVIDFGTPRTVSGLDLPGGATVVSVFAWLGSQFSPSAAFRAGATPDASPVFPEVRTERLRVVMSQGLTDTQLAEVRLRLPEPPSGLAIRIGEPGSAPVWTHPDPVAPRSSVSEPDADGWDRDSRRIVVLTDALAAQAGDPLAPDDAVPLQLTLTTAVPCRLALALHGTLAYRRIRRVRFGDAGDTAASFDFSAGEGLLERPLVLPAPPAGQARRIDALRWTAVGELPPWRALPPLGPGAALGPDGAALAELLVDAQRAACVRLSGAGGLAALTAVRLPLRVAGDGAEARVVLWSVAADGAAAALPLEPLPQGASDPLTLAPGAGAGETWFSFAFPKPVPVNPARMPWLALVVSRGALRWALGRAGETAAEQVVRRGPPNGPWKALPAPLQDPALLDARARLRLVGLPAKTTPLAPLTLAVLGDAAPAAAALPSAPELPLDPSAKGVAGAALMAPPLAAAQPVLRLLSRTAGSVQLRDVDVISSN